MIGRGRNVLSTSRDGTAILWDVPTQTPIYKSGSRSLSPCLHIFTIFARSYPLISLVLFCSFKIPLTSPLYFSFCPSRFIEPGVSPSFPPALNTIRVGLGGSSGPTSGPTITIALTFDHPLPPDLSQILVMLELRVTLLLLALRVGSFFSLIFDFAPRFDYFP